MEDDMPTTPKLVYGYVDDSIRPFKAYLEKNNFVEGYDAHRLVTGEFELYFSHPSRPLDIKGLHMFVTSVGKGGPTVDNANVFVRERREDASKPPGKAVFKISTANVAPANTSFHFLLVYFHPTNLEEFHEVHDGP
jgi:hypothetical protein